MTNLIATIIAIIVTTALISLMVFAASQSVIIVVAVVVTPALFLAYDAITSYNDKKHHEAFMRSIG